MRSIPREDVPVVIDDGDVEVRLRYEAFYWAPGHAPEALEDSEYVDFSPTNGTNTVSRAGSKRRSTHTCHRGERHSLVAL